MVSCKLRKGLNILITYWRNGYEKEETISVKNARIVEEMFDFICDCTLTIVSVYFCFCDDDCKEIRAKNCANCYTIEEYWKAYDWVVKGIPTDQNEEVNPNRKIAKN